MGLNNELNYGLQKDDEEIFGDQSESTVNVNLAEDTIIKQGKITKVRIRMENSEFFLSRKFTH